MDWLGRVLVLLVIASLFFPYSMGQWIGQIAKGFKKEFEKKDEKD